MLAPPDRLIDTHQHLWDLRAQRLPWLAGAPQVLRETYDQAAYRAATAGRRVQAIYMEVDIAPEERLAEAERVVGDIRSGTHPTVAAVVSGPIGEPGFVEYLDKLLRWPEVKGLRRVLHGASTPKGYCLAPQFIEDIQTLGEKGLRFDLCMRPAELADAVVLVRACPDTRFVLDHCGNGDPKAFGKPPTDVAPSHDAADWQRNVEQLAQLPNVICKISGIIASLPQDWSTDRLAPVINHCLDAFGGERVVFGGDWPVCRLRAEYQDWVIALQEIIQSRPAGLQANLWYANAERFYGVKGS